MCTEFERRVVCVPAEQVRCLSRSSSYAATEYCPSISEDVAGSPCRSPPPCIPPEIITRKHSDELRSVISYHRSPTLSPCPTPLLSRPASPALSQSVVESLDSSVPPTHRIVNRDYCATSGTSTRRNDRFWYADGTVVVKVEDTLYKLYKGILARQSTFFSSDRITVELKSPPLWSPPSPPLSRKSKAFESAKLCPDPPELVGIGSESDPAKLDVPKADFEKLLSILFPNNFGSTAKLSVEDWAAIASAAEKLEFNSILEAAKAEVLGHYDAFRLVEIGQKRENHSYLLEGVRMLHYRDSALTREEGGRLGIDLAVIVGDVRERSARGSSWSDIMPWVVHELEEMMKVKKEE